MRRLHLVDQETAGSVLPSGSEESSSENVIVISDDEFSSNSAEHSDVEDTNDRSTVSGRNYRDALVGTASGGVVESDGNSSATLEDCPPEPPFNFAVNDTADDLALFAPLQWVQQNLHPNLTLPDPARGPVGPGCRRAVEYLQLFPPRGRFTNGPLPESFYQHQNAVARHLDTHRRNY